MFHLTDRLLAKLIDGSASPAELQRIRRHVGECRACTHRFEEWRDNFTEIDEHFPELAIEPEQLATETPGGLVVLPGSASPRRIAPDPTTMLWIGAVLMALLVVYAADRSRRVSAGRSVAAMQDTREPRRPQSAPPDAAGDSASRPDTAPAATPPGVAAGAAPVPARKNDAPTTATPRPAVPSIGGRANPAVSPRFQTVGLPEASRRVGGPVRSLTGMTVDRIEVGPGSAVPGARPGLEVIRMIYSTPDGGRLLLDQQRIPPDSDGLRRINDLTLESGGTAYGTGPNGVRVASWLDADGYRISLAARASLDSLKKLVALVR